MSYFLDGKVSREFIFNCNPGTNQNVLNANTAVTPAELMKQPDINDSKSLWVDNLGTSLFRFNLTEDLYPKKIALKWAQIPLDMENLPPNIDCYLFVRLYWYNSAADTFTLQEFMQNISQGLSLDGNNMNFPVFNPIAKPNFITAANMANFIQDCIQYGMEQPPAGITAYVPANVAQTTFSFSNDNQAYQLSMYHQSFNAAGGNRYPITGIEIKIGFGMPGMNFNNAAGNVKILQNVSIPAATPAMYRQAARTASSTFGLGNNSRLKTNPGIIPNGVGFEGAMFLYSTIDFFTGICNYIPSPGNVTPDNVVPTNATGDLFITIGGFAPNNASPPYFLIHSNLMQSAKIKPMISVHQQDNPLVAPYSSQSYPLGAESSTTVLAAVPLQINAVQTYGVVYFWRNDNAHDFLMEMSPSTFRQLEFWITYPDGTPVSFYQQFPTFAVNIIDNNESI